MSVQVQLNDVLIGGKPVAFDSATGTLSIAGEEVTVEAWMELRRRIDLIMKRCVSPERWQEIKEEMARIDKVSRLPGVMREHQSQPTFTTSNFLGENFLAINELKRGRLKRAPKWLRWAFDAVVTKEGYGKD